MRALSLALVLLIGCGAQSGSGGPPVPGPSQPSPEPSPTTSIAAEPKAPLAFSSENAKEHVRVLANRIGPRPAGSNGYRRAIRYVRGKLEAAGWTTRLQGFRTSNGSRSWNVIAVLPDGEPDVLLGAHLDTVARSPGGNDNASGVGILLELARVLEGTDEGRRATLVAFGAEERQPAGGHHFGSQVYVRRMSARPEMMVSVDMVGRARPVVIAWLGIGKRRAVRALRDAAKAEGVPATTRRMGDVSDHGPFEKAGVPAALLWTGPHPDYHSPRDDPGDVQRRALGRLGRLLLRLLRNVVEAPLGFE